MYFWNFQASYSSLIKPTGFPRKPRGSPRNSKSESFIAKDVFLNSEDHVIDLCNYFSGLLYPIKEIYSMCISFWAALGELIFHYSSFHAPCQPHPIHFLSSATVYYRSSSMLLILQFSFPLPVLCSINYASVFYVNLTSVSFMIKGPEDIKARTDFFSRTRKCFRQS